MARKTIGPCGGEKERQKSEAPRLFLLLEKKKREPYILSGAKSHYSRKENGNLGKEKGEGRLSLKRQHKEPVHNGRVACEGGEQIAKRKEWRTGFILHLLILMERRCFYKFSK